MNTKHIALLLAVVVGTTAAGIGIVSAAHEPTDPDEIYIHKVEAVVQGPNAQICITEMGENLNRVLIEGETTHTNTTFFHDDGDEDVRIHVPELNVPPGHNIVLFSNGENPTIDSAASPSGTCTAPGVDVTQTLAIGEYNINVGSITLTEGVDIKTGPNVSDSAPAPGSGGGGFGLSTGSSSDEPALGPSPNGTDDVVDPNVSERPQPDVDGTENVTNNTTRFVNNTTKSVNDTINETTDESKTIVEHVQDTVDDTLDSIFGDETGTPDATDEIAEPPEKNGNDTLTGASGVTGAFGLTGAVGLLGILFGFIRHWSS